MAQASKQKPIRLPHGWNAKLQRMTGYTQPTVTRVVQEAEVSHPVWTAYEQLLSQEVKAKAKAQQEKKERREAAERMRNQLNAA